MRKWNEFSEIVADVYEVANEWAEEYIYEIEDVTCGYDTINGYIETRNLYIYLEDLIELRRRLKKLGARITFIESAGTDDEGLLIWISKL